MKFVEINWEQDLAEITQQLNTTFALAFKPNNTTISNNMPFVKCRDFFGDVLHAVETDKTQGIYGFKFDPKKQQLDKLKLRMLVKCVSPESCDNLINNFKHYRNELKQWTGVSYGLCKKIDDTTVLITASNFWQKSVPNISWYSFFIKCCSYPLDNTKTFFDNIKDLKYPVKIWDGSTVEQTTNEANYLTESGDVLYTFLKNLKKLNKDLKYCHGHDVKKEINTVHNSSGFTAMCKNFWGEFGQRLKAYHG